MVLPTNLCLKAKQSCLKYKKDHTSHKLRCSVVQVKPEVPFPLLKYPGCEKLVRGIGQLRYQHVGCPKSLWAEYSGMSA